MKRIILTFSMLLCFAFTAQVASAYTIVDTIDFDSNIAALAAEAGGRAVKVPPVITSGAPWDLVLVYSKGGDNPLSGSILNESGFQMVQDIVAESFMVNGEALMGKTAWALYQTSGAVYEAGANSLVLKNGTIFVAIGDMDYVFALTPAGVYSPAVPLPGALLLFGTGAAGLAALRRRMA